MCLFSWIGLGEGMINTHICAYSRVCVHTFTHERRNNTLFKNDFLSKYFTRHKLIYILLKLKCLFNSYEYNSTTSKEPFLWY